MGIGPCGGDAFEAILEIVNDAAEAYRGVIPPDRFHDPYMSADALKREIAGGIAFHGYRDSNRLIGVMGVQDVQDVTLIRHAYVRTVARRAGIGSALLAHIMAGAKRPVLIGTWRAASWAIAFYRKNGFALIPDAEIAQVLRRYWAIPERQIEESVVLASGPVPGASAPPSNRLE